VIDKAPDTNELLRRIEALEKQARILPSEFSSGQEDLLHGVLNDRLKSQQHESRDHLNRGLNPLKITPGTSGQVLTTTTAAGQVDATWGRVDPKTGISPVPRAKISYVRSAGYGQGQRVNTGTYTYVADFNTIVYNNGCTIDLSGTGDYGAGATNPQNNYIQVPIAGMYEISGSILWYPPGAAIRVGAAAYNQTQNKYYAIEFDHMLTGYNEVTVPFSVKAELAANDAISAVAYWDSAAGFHVLAGTADTDARYNRLEVEYLGPVS
jgi:hypothetical protein